MNHEISHDKYAKWDSLTRMLLATESFSNAFEFCLEKTENFNQNKDWYSLLRFFSVAMNATRIDNKLIRSLDYFSNYFKSLISKSFA